MDSDEARCGAGGIHAHRYIKAGWVSFTTGGGTDLDGVFGHALVLCPADGDEAREVSEHLGEALRGGLASGWLRVVCGLGFRAGSWG